MSKRGWHAWAYFPVLVTAGLCNSFSVASSSLYRPLFPLFAISLAIYICYLLKISTFTQRTMFLVGMLVCSFGENFLVYGLDLYHFAPTVSEPYAVPPYVLVGHGYTIWFSLVITEQLTRRWSAERLVHWVFALGLAICATRTMLGQDYFGAAWVIFLIAAWAGVREPRVRLSLCVMFIIGTCLELVGVALDAWHWHASTYYFNPKQFPMGDPPAAVGAFYVVGELFTWRLIQLFKLDRPESVPAPP